MSAQVRTRAARADALRRVMRHHAAGVVVITTANPEPSGFCATSLTSICLDPPVVSFAVDAATRSGAVWASASWGLVHLLSAGQQALASNFATPGIDKFGDGRGWSTGPRGLPLLDQAPAWLLVHHRTRLVVGDHLVVLCDVVESTTKSSALAPLIYHNGGFYAVAD